MLHSSGLSDSLNKEVLGWENGFAYILLIVTQNSNMQGCM